MTAQGLPVERLRAYLRELKPEAQALLVAEIERGTARGADIPGASLILEELRPALSQLAAAPAVSTADPMRLFMRPVEPFVVVPGATRVLPGKIEQAALARLWDWISNDLVPEPATAFVAYVPKVAEDDPALRQTTHDLQVEAAREMRAALDAAVVDERVGRHLTVRIRTPHALHDARTLQLALEHRDALAHIAGRLPAQIRSFGDEQVDTVRSLIMRSFPTQHDARALALILVADRLAAFWQLIRLAIRSAESDAANKVAQAPLAGAVDLVLAQTRTRIEELRGLIRRGRFNEMTGPLKDVHDAARAMRTEMELAADSAWGRELGAIRAAIADLLKSELEGTPGAVRRLLRPRGPKDMSSGASLDATEVEEIEGRIGLVSACRAYAGELAINQIATRVHSELQTYLDSGVSSLIEALRSTTGPDRNFRQSQVDAALRFASKLFGPEYASLLSRAAAVAAVERKPATS